MTSKSRFKVAKISSGNFCQE